MKYLDEIEARTNAATEGPWEEGERCVFTLDGTPVVSDDVIHYAHGMAGEGVRNGEDAEFIAHARTDVPDMAAALRAVLELHAEMSYGCAVCEEQNWALDWPCPTVTAIRQHLGEKA